MTKSHSELRGALIALVVLVCGLSLALPQVLSHVRLKPALEHYAAWTLLETNGHEFLRIMTRYNPQHAREPVGPQACKDLTGLPGDPEPECEPIRLVAPWNPLRPSALTLRIAFSNWTERPRDQADSLAFNAVVFRARVPGIDLPIDDYVVVIATRGPRCGESVLSEPRAIVFKPFSKEGELTYRMVHRILCTTLHQPNRQPPHFPVARAAMQGRGIEPDAANAGRFFSAFGVDLEDGPAIEIGPVKVPAGRALIVATVIMVALTMSLLVALLRAPRRPASPAIADRLAPIAQAALAVATTGTLLWLCLDIGNSFGIRYSTAPTLSVLLDVLLGSATPDATAAIPGEVRHLLLAATFAIAVCAVTAAFCFVAATQKPRAP